MKKIDLTGQRFGRWTVISWGSIKNGVTKWNCICDCGIEREVSSGHLRAGESESCGCLRLEEMRLNLVGKRVGKLTVKSFYGIKSNGTYWNCICDCGVEKIVKGGTLSNNLIKSCGCGRGEMLIERNTTHGMAGTKFYKTWKGIKQRCTNKNAPHYNNYGGRGIKFSDEWNNFNTFKKDMYQEYLNHVDKFGKKNTSIDRIDVNGGYCKENCRWATAAIQMNNKTNNRRITFNGENLTISEWSEKLKINFPTLTARLNLGLPLEKVFNTHSDRYKINLTKTYAKRVRNK